MPAFRAALAERVVWIMLSDSNSLKDGLGWASGIGRALQARFGLWATLMKPPVNGGGSTLTLNEGAPASSHNLAGKTDGTDFADGITGGRFQGYAYTGSASGSEFTDIFFDNAVGDDYKMNFDYTDDLKICLSYGRGMTNGGTFTFEYRNEGPTGGYVTQSLSCASGALGTTTVAAFDHAAATRDGMRVISAAIQAGKAFFQDLVWIERPNLTSGFLHQPLVTYGGHGLDTFYSFALDGGSGIGNTSAEHLLSIIMGRANGADTKFVFWINSGLNDRNISDPSAEAFANNSATIEAWLEARIAAAGGSEENCYFIHCPSHPVSTPDDSDLIAYRSAVATLSDTHGRSCAVDISQLITSTEMTANGYYAAGPDANHMVEAGYVAVGDLIISEFEVTMTDADLEGIAQEVWDYIDRGLTTGVTRVTNPWQQGTLNILKGATASASRYIITKSSDWDWPTDVTAGYTITLTATPTDATLVDEPTAPTFTNTGNALTTTTVNLGAMTAANTDTLIKPNGNGANAYTYRVTATKTGELWILETGVLSVG
jgi:hypothetical protein